MSRYITLLQPDTKKFIAFSRVTHITFIMVGLVRALKVTMRVVLMLSLAHG